MSFSETLRAAVRASGLSLQRIQHKLRQRDISLSIATLSYWQSGERRPGRRSSLNAVRQLEHVLRVRPGLLVATLFPLEAEADKDLAQLLATFDTSWDQAFTRISHHETFLVGMQSLTTRQVLKATVDGPDRWILIHHADQAPVLTDVRHCRVGRTVSQSGYLVAELLFDRALSKGDTIVADYSLTWPSAAVTPSEHQRKLRYPVRELLLQVQFDPQAPPQECLEYTSALNARTTFERPLRVDGWHTAHRVVLNARPGTYGIRWNQGLV